MPSARGDRDGGGTDQRRLEFGEMGFRGRLVGVAQRDEIGEPARAGTDVEAGEGGLAVVGGPGPLDAQVGEVGPRARDGRAEASGRQVGGGRDRGAGRDGGGEPGQEERVGVVASGIEAVGEPAVHEAERGLRRRAQGVPLDRADLEAHARRVALVEHQGIRLQRVEARVGKAVDDLVEIARETGQRRALGAGAGARGEHGEQGGEARPALRAEPRPESAEQRETPRRGLALDRRLEGRRVDRRRAERVAHRDARIRRVAAVGGVERLLRRLEVRIAIRAARDGGAEAPHPARVALARRRGGGAAVAGAAAAREGEGGEKGKVASSHRLRALYTRRRGISRSARRLRAIFAGSRPSSAGMAGLLRLSGGPSPGRGSPPARRPRCGRRASSDRAGGRGP